MNTDMNVFGGGGMLERYRTAKERFYDFQYEADVPALVALSFGFACLTGIAAQVRIVLPFTPVPVTLQTFAVLLAGIVLGIRWGGLSQCLYVSLGLSGVPWFTGAAAGLGHLFGPTGGYLAGFIVAAIAIGYVTDRIRRSRQLPWLLVVLLVANFVIIYGFGLPWLYVWLTLVDGSSVTLAELLTMGLLPFIPGDIVKLLGATAVGRAVAPAESFDRRSSTEP